MLNPSPSSPARPPIEHLYFLCRDQDDNEVFFMTHGFSAIYAVHYWLDQITNTPASINWKDDNTILLTHKGYSLTIKGTDLQTAMEAKLTKEELKWTAPYPDSRLINKLSHFYKDTSPKPSFTPSPAPSSPPTSQKPSVSKRHRTQKTVDGMITVAQMAESLDMQPNKARQALRKAGITKPTNGWHYKEGSKEAAKVLKTLSDSQQS